MSLIRIPKEADAPTFVCIADLHLHHLPTWRAEWCAQFVHEVLGLQDSFEDEDIPILVILGDLTEVRDRLDSRTLNWAIELIMSWDGPVYYVTGQHDTAQPGWATLSALHETRCENGPWIIDREPTSFDRYWFVPYARDPGLYREWLEEIPNDSVVFTHVGIREVLGKWGAETAPSAKHFSRFSEVWSGDIHEHGRYGRLEYVGAPSQRDWRDEKVDGRIVFLDSSGAFQCAPQIIHPKHMRVKTRKKLKSFKAPRGGAIVRVEGFDASEIELENLRGRKNVIEVTQAPGSVDEVARRITPASVQKDPTDVVADYLDGVDLPDDLDSEFLVHVAHEVLDQCK